MHYFLLWIFRLYNLQYWKEYAIAKLVGQKCLSDRDVQRKTERSKSTKATKNYTVSSEVVSLIPTTETNTNKTGGNKHHNVVFTSHVPRSLPLLQDKRTKANSQKMQPLIVSSYLHQCQKCVCVCVCVSEGERKIISYWVSRDE